MYKQTLLLLLLVLINTQAMAKEFIYQGKVKGMVCAFCVYSVSKNIGQLPEVDAKTINVDLKSGIVNFRSTSEVSFKKLSTVFSDSGFKLIELKEVSKPTLKIPDYESKPVLTLNLNTVYLHKYESVIESIGNIAATSTGKLLIIAPESVESDILKPMIGGKQKIARVQYIFDRSNTVQIKLFLKAE